MESNDLRCKLEKVESKVQTMETYLKVAVIVGAVLGFSGAWLGSLISGAKSDIASIRSDLGEVQAKAREASAEIDRASSEAAQKVRSSANQTVVELGVAAREKVKEELASQLDARFKKEDARAERFAKWVRFIFDQAEQTGLPKHEGANGWWQKALIEKAAAARSDLDAQQTIPAGAPRTGG